MAFNINDIVWAKIKGFKWWPAKISKIITSSKYRVEFYGENNYATVSNDKIVEYKKGYNEYSKVNKTDLKKSIKLADADLLKRKEETKQLNLVENQFIQPKETIIVDKQVMRDFTLKGKREKSTLDKDYEETLLDEVCYPSTGNTEKSEKSKILKDDLIVNNKIMKIKEEESDEVCNTKTNEDCDAQIKELLNLNSNSDIKASLLTLDLKLSNKSDIEVLKALLVSQLNRDVIVNKIVNHIIDKKSPNQIKHEEEDKQPKTQVESKPEESLFINNTFFSIQNNIKKEVIKIDANKNVINFIEVMKDFYDPSNKGMKKELAISCNLEKLELFKGLESIYNMLSLNSIKSNLSIDFVSQEPQGIKCPVLIEILYNLLVNEISIFYDFSSSVDFYLKLLNSNYLDDLILSYVKKYNYSYNERNQISDVLLRTPLFEEFKQKREILVKLGNYIDFLLITLGKQHNKARLIEKIENIK